MYIKAILHMRSLNVLQNLYEDRQGKTDSINAYQVALG